MEIIEQMTLYEKLTLICSGIAILLSILIPLFQFIIKLIIKQARSLKLSIIPFETNSLSLFFNESGSYFKFSFCIECLNKPSTISSIKARIIKKEDKTEKSFTWSSFEPVIVNWFGYDSSNRINSVSYARPYRINPGSLEPFIIEFSNSDSSELQKICFDRNQKLQRYLCFNNKQFNSIYDCHNSYIELDEYQELSDSFKRFLFWTPSDYELTMDVFHDIQVKETYKYTFSVSEEDYTLLCKNIESIIFSQLYKQSNQPIPPFNTLFKTVCKT